MGTIEEGSTSEYVPLTPKMAWQLAAPHTWPAAIIPVLIATACSLANTGYTSLFYSWLLLVICILMQSSVNTFNDYFDYVKGADSAEDNVEESDSVLVYNAVNPRSVLILACVFLGVAFALGMIVVREAGLIPLAIALVGALVVVAYSGGKTPLSYLPIGEAVSGLVMGGLIPLASYQVLAGSLSPLMVIWAIPPIIGIALIMMTNNTCDIEKDIAVQRRTLPVLLGRRKALLSYHALMVIWVLAIVVNVAVFYPRGLIVLPFALLASYPLIRALWLNPLSSPTRIGAMGQICSVNVALGAFYAAAIIV